jgi:hypothetical protein
MDSTLLLGRHLDRRADGMTGGILVVFRSSARVQTMLESRRTTHDMRRAAYLDRMRGRLLSIIHICLTGMLDPHRRVSRFS